MSAALRARVAQGISRVVSQGKSLTEVLPDYDHLEPRDRALARELTFGTLRQYLQLMALTKQLLQKPLKKKDNDVLCLILVGLYQLFHTRIPDHAVLSETVQATLKIKKKWAKNLVNALLRKALRESEQLHTFANQSQESALNMPGWIIKQLKQDWPEDYVNICINSRLRAALTLRVNSRQTSRDEYLHQLEQAGIAASTHVFADHALVLEKSCDVTSLPGYLKGDFSVQDAAAQLAAQLLDVKPGQRILDACAAPGGKTAHILELTDNKSDVLALDNSARRLIRLDENLKRLNLKAKSLVADASDPDIWFEGDKFDRILCDAPCSALGIIRRHPDIAILRRPTDIVQLTQIQEQLLDALWAVVKSGGVLLYSTCSILKAENTQQIAKFLHRHSDAKLKKEWQILPGDEQMDGFYYAKLQKR
ncbi:MAG: 16S rRNA (cytosine(967)-C(5))-methyltransferase [Gammaproteobacteria bacterium]|nr:MAG: 16S rRNA (cytosine(967)-C(5))-methyltransferase [Gammaproteobacteria bacterium]